MVIIEKPAQVDGPANAWPMPDILHERQGGRPVRVCIEGTGWWCSQPYSNQSHITTL